MKNSVVAKRLALIAAVVVGLMTSLSGSASAAIQGEFQIVEKPAGAPAGLLTTVNVADPGAAPPGCVAAGGIPPLSCTVNAQGLCTNFNPCTAGAGFNDYILWNLNDVNAAQTVWTPLTGAAATDETQAVIVLTAGPPGPGGAANPLVGAQITGRPITPAQMAALTPIPAAPQPRAPGASAGLMFFVPATAIPGTYKLEVQFLNAAGAVVGMADPSVLIPALPVPGVLALGLMLGLVGFYFVRRRTTPLALS